MYRKLASMARSPQVKNWRTRKRSDFLFTSFSPKISPLNFFLRLFMFCLFKHDLTVAAFGFMYTDVEGWELRYHNLCSLYDEQQHVGPIVAVVWIPISLFAPHLLKAIYKVVADGVPFPGCLCSLSSPLMWLWAGSGPAPHSTSPHSLLLHIYSVFNAFMLTTPGIGKG